MGFVGRVKDSVLALFGYPTKQRPEQVMDSMIATMSVNLRKSKGQVAIVLASQKRLQEQLHQNMNMVTQYQVKALAAMGRNEEEHARDLLKKKRRYEETVKQLKGELNKHKGTSDRLMEMVRKLELKLEETKRNKLLLITQKQCYETSQFIEEGMDGVDGGFSDVLESLEDDVNSLRYSTRLGIEAEDEDDDPLALPEGDDLDDEDEADLGTDTRSSLEDEMEALRERVAQGALPEAVSNEEAGILEIRGDDEDEPEDDDEDGGIQILATNVDEAPPARSQLARAAATAPAEAEADHAVDDEDELEAADDDYGEYEDEDDEEPPPPRRRKRRPPPRRRRRRRAVADDEYEDEYADDEAYEDEYDEYDEYEDEGYDDEDDGYEDEEEDPPPRRRRPAKAARRKKAPPRRPAKRKKKKAPPPEPAPEPEAEDDDDGIVFI